MIWQPLFFKHDFSTSFIWGYLRTKFEGFSICLSWVMAHGQKWHKQVLSELVNPLTAVAVLKNHNLLAARFLRRSWFLQRSRFLQKTS